MLTAIYTLTDPFNQDIRYVGQTQQFPLYRLSQHIMETANKPTAELPRKNQWIAELVQLGVSPEIEIVEYCDSSHAHKREQFWINKFRADGHNLYNVVFNSPPPPRRGIVFTEKQQQRAVTTSKRLIRVESTHLPARKDRLSGESMGDLAYRWLVENDRGWDARTVPSARRIIKEMELPISPSSAQRGRDDFIRDYKL